jgi:ELWxxDGT repeat protein
MRLEFVRSTILDRKVSRTRVLTRAATVRLLTVAAAVVAAATLLGGALAPRGDAAATISVQLVKDMNPGSGNGGASEFAVAGGTLYFQGANGTDGYELWKSDGTASGTVMVKNINPTGDSLPYNLTNLGGILFFTANDGTNGKELWRSDGSESGTYMVRNINNNPAGASSNPIELTVLGDTLYFAASDGLVGEELWKSNGTEAGTAMVENINPFGDSGPVELTAVGGVLYFQATDGVSGYELWKAGDIGGGNAALVKDIYSGATSSIPEELAAFNGQLYSQADDGTNGVELWKSDGTFSGTVMIANISPGAGDSNPWSLTPVNNTLFFVADNGVNGYELWKSDGVAGGTTSMVKDINVGGSTNYSELFALGNSLYFVADDGINGAELWKSDGTASGTLMVKDIDTTPGAGGNPSHLADLNGILYFVADDGLAGLELWKSDGTAAGTNMVADINPSGGSSPFDLTVFGFDVYFDANDGTHGAELWRAGDFSPPETQIDSGPSGSTTSTTPSFTFSADEAGTFQCALDGGAMSACSSPKAVGPLSDGAHTFHVRAIDSSGNLDASPAARSFTVDTTAPETQIASGLSGLVKNKSATFTFSSPEASAVFECRLDGSAWASCSSPKSYTGLSDGAHAFNVRAIDLVGNIDASPAERSFTVDTRAPQTKIAKHPKKIVRTKTAKTKAVFTFTSSERSSRFSCKLDKMKWKSCTQRTTYKVRRGKHTLLVRATDRARNTDRTPAKWVWTVKRG